AAATAAAVVVSQRPAPAVAHASGLLHTTQARAADRIAAMAAAGDIHAGHALDDMRLAAAGVQSVAVPNNMSLPADNEGAPARLAASPRKGEFVTIDVGGTTVRTWVLQPQGQGKATAAL